MPPQHRGDDLSALATLMQSTINPLISKLQILETKVDSLNQDRVTRTDLEKLRGEIVGGFVDRASYEARHAAVVDRCMALDMAVRELRKDTEDEFKKLIDMGTQSWHRIDAKLDAMDKVIEDKLKEQQQAQLSATDRAWLRATQLASYAAIGLSALDLLLRLLHVQ